MTVFFMQNLPEFLHLNKEKQNSIISIDELRVDDRDPLPAEPRAIAEHALDRPARVDERRVSDLRDEERPVADLRGRDERVAERPVDWPWVDRWDRETELLRDEP